MRPEFTCNDGTLLEALHVASASFMMDEDTFRAFYNRTAPGIMSYLARITGDRQLAEDLLQEAFYRFLRAKPDHESESHRRNYLYRIATNLAHDARRRSLVRLPAAIAGHDIERLPGGPGPSETGTDVERAMALLKPRERAMLWLAYGEGASHQEIAGALGLKATSMKLMLFRARRKLAELLRGGKGGGQ
ncbi:MAG: RNA polymerase sigma factor [Acidobacteria bacterium]|nr:RNA polymerase sigma factor [Acidobacteriota bacterium]